MNVSHSLILTWTTSPLSPRPRSHCSLLGPLCGVKSRVLYFTFSFFSLSHPANTVSTCLGFQAQDQQSAQIFPSYQSPHLIYQSLCLRQVTQIIRHSIARGLGKALGTQHQPPISSLSLVLPLGKSLPSTGSPSKPSCLSGFRNGSIHTCDRGEL